ncbi:MAG: TIGR03435 family protein [Bryobacteraceae bacterium]
MLRIAAAALAAIGLMLALLAHAQTTAANTTSLKFEVATIKPGHDDGHGPSGIRPAPGGERYIATNITLKALITVAYRIRPDQVIGGAGWMDTDAYDMNAKAERPSSIEEMHLMLQDLLADRFKLRFHRETKEMPIYALTVDKDGPKFRPHEAQSAGDPWIDTTFNPFPHATWHAKFAPMDYFAWRLSGILDRPVVDHTNLKGGYDFELSYTADLPPGMPPGALLNGEAIDTSGPTIFEAIGKQLGLKLERGKGPVDTLVIDHAEKPPEN